MFDWHQDKNDKKKSAILMIIILLSETILSNQILAQVQIEYKTQICTIVLSSILCYESYYAKEKTTKLCLFLQNSDDIIDSEAIK